MSGSLWDTLRAGASSEEQSALNFLFPAKSRFEYQQMLTDQQPRAVTPFSVLGVFRRRYKSKVLQMFQEEHNINKIAVDRKGRLEGAEIVAGLRRANRGEED